jgi:hypothetical protein
LIITFHNHKSLLFSKKLLIRFVRKQRWYGLFTWERRKRGGEYLVTARSVLLWTTHVWCREIEEEFEKFLSLDYPGSPEVWLLLDAKIPQAGDLARKYEHCLIIDPDNIFRSLPYPRIEGYGILHHSHFPVLEFFLSHRHYDYYWFTEFDVRYTGDWGSFLRSFEPYTHDLITSHIRHYSEEPLWLWWDTLRHPTKTIDRDSYLRSFNVIFRISNRALEFIDQAQRDDWQGFNEVSLPTLLQHGGYRIMDFGGDGDFTPPGLRNIAYTSYGLKNGLLYPFCTMCWRPSRSKPGFRRNKLYHSIKPQSMTEPVKERLSYLYTWMRNFVRYHLLLRAE